MTSQTLPVSESLRVYDDILQTIGRTPLVQLKRLGRGLPVPLYAKVESFNPGGSIKDRIAVNIIQAAERSGQLKPGGTVVEATSGNTGLGLAMVCAQKGYQAVFVLPDKMSREKVQLLQAYGARVVITPTAVPPEDPRSNYRVAERIAKETPNAVLADQYRNPENPRSHTLTTGPEIWEQTGGRVTDVVIGMGTGGTISGVGQYLKEKNPKIRIIGVDPAGSLLRETWKLGRVPDDPHPKTYKIEGIGEDFLPSTLDLAVIDQVITVGDREAFLAARRLVREEAIFSGGSSGAALAAALEYARGLEPGRLVVVILPDSGSRYLSKFYDDRWMSDNGFTSSDRSGHTLREVLSSKPSRQLIASRVDDRIADVIAMMKAHDISQVPVLNGDGSLAGLVTEADLLRYIVENGSNHPTGETLSGVTHPARPVFPASEPLEAALPAILQDQAVLVTEQEQPVGILTEIDVLDFLSQEG